MSLLVQVSRQLALTPNIKVAAVLSSNFYRYSQACMHFFVSDDLSDDLT